MAYIESIQKVSIILTSGDSETATITSVDTANSFLVWGGITGDDQDSNSDELLCGLELTNATTVTLYRDDISSSSDITAEFYVIESSSDLIDSIQTGSITIGSGTTTNTSSISAVDLNNSIVSFLGGESTRNSTIDYGRDFATLDLTNTTTVTAERGASSTESLTAYFQVIEFNSSVIESIQREATVSTGVSATLVSNHTINSVNVDNTILFWAGSSSSALSTYRSEMQRIELTSSTQLTTTRQATGSSTRYFNVGVVEFVSGVIESVQRGDETASTGLTIDTTISSVDTDYSVAAHLGSTGATNSEVATEIISSVSLTSSTNIRGTRGETNGTDDFGYSYEVWEFTTGPSAGSVASSTGVSTVSGVGASTVSSIGSSGGSSVVSGIGASKILAEAVSSGVATVSGAGAVGANEVSGAGSSIGVSTVSGAGASKILAEAVSSGVATVSGAGASTASSIGTSNGSSIVSGVGSSKVLSVGVSQGTATVDGQSFVGSVALSSGSSAVSGVGASSSSSIGASNGSSTVNGIGSSKALTVATSTGSSIVSGVGTTGGTSSGAGISNGVATVTGVSASKVQSVVTSVGTSAVNGVALSKVNAVGSSFGVSTVTGAAIKVISAVGVSNGVSTVSGVGASKAFSVFSSNGISAVLGASQVKHFSVGVSQGTATVLGIDGSTGIVNLDQLNLSQEISLLNNGIDISINKELSVTVAII